MWQKDLFAVIVIFVIIYFTVKYLSKDEGFIMPWETSYNVTFLSLKQTHEFLHSDPDNYSMSLSPLDLYARKASIEFDYRRRSSAAAKDFTDDQKQRYSAAAARADKFFATLQIDRLDCYKFVHIPWVFALTRDKEYEDGLPHTRANIIFVSDSVDESPERLTRTLIHEKVHIYQRMYTEAIAQYLHYNNYIIWKQRMGVPRIRANPDLDPYIYMDPKTKAPMLCLYASDKPESITDVEHKFVDYEHPFEEMAYKIDKLYNGK
jgi:hypothetical protein